MVIAHVDGQPRDRQRHHRSVGEHEHGLAPVSVGDLRGGVLEPLDDGVTVLSRLPDRELLQPVGDDKPHAQLGCRQLGRPHRSVHGAAVDPGDPARTHLLDEAAHLLAALVRQPAATELIFVQT